MSYWKNKPKVIPIDLGRQPCVDDFLIENTTLKRTFHQVIMRRSSRAIRSSKRIKNGEEFEGLLLS